MPTLFFKGSFNMCVHAAQRAKKHAGSYPMSPVYILFSQGYAVGMLDLTARPPSVFICIISVRWKWDPTSLSHVALSVCIVSVCWFSDTVAPGHSMSVCSHIRHVNRAQTADLACLHANKDSHTLNTYSIQTWSHKHTLRFFVISQQYILSRN